MTAWRAKKLLKDLNDWFYLRCLISYYCFYSLSLQEELVHQPTWINWTLTNMDTEYRRLFKYSGIVFIGYWPISTNEILSDFLLGIYHPLPDSQEPAFLNTLEPTDTITPVLCPSATGYSDPYYPLSLPNFSAYLQPAISHSYYSLSLPVYNWLFWLL